MPPIGDKRSIAINGHDTGISVEDTFWEALREMAADRRMWARWAGTSRTREPTAIFLQQFEFTCSIFTEAGLRKRPVALAFTTYADASESAWRQVPGHNNLSGRRCTMRPVAKHPQNRTDPHVKIGGDPANS